MTGLSDYAGVGERMGHIFLEKIMQLSESCDTRLNLLFSTIAGVWLAGSVFSTQRGVWCCCDISILTEWIKYDMLLTYLYLV